MTAPTCSLTGCRKPTRHTSGRCEHHRGAPNGVGARPPVPPPAPVSTTPPAPAPVPYRDAFGTDYVVNGRGLSVRPVDTRADEHPRYLLEDGGEATTGRDFHLIRTIEYGIGPGRRDPLHRVDGPAYVAFHEDLTGLQGTWIREFYYLGGKPGRTDGGPTSVLRDAIGQFLEEIWTDTDSREHRLDGPAVVKRHPDGSLKNKNYLRNGRPSRIDGPAETSYSSSGEVYETYALGGRYFSATDFYGDVGKLSATALRKHFTGTPLEEVSRGREHDVVAALRAGVRTPEGVAEVLGGAPAEWVRAYEESKS